MRKQYRDIPFTYCQGCGREAASLSYAVRRWGRMFKFCGAECGRRFEGEYQDYGDYFDTAA